MTQCKQCNTDYKPKRANSLFCSAKCRVYYNRAVSVTKDEQVSVTSVPDISVTDTLERPLTPNEKNGITHYGKCHACNKDVSHLRCICSDCISKGITHSKLDIDITRCIEPVKKFKRKRLNE